MKIFVTAKTYPNLSSKYNETVCTAGINEYGEWVRIYPIPYRNLKKEQKFKKYQWIDVELMKDKSDIRPESYKLIGDITPLKAVNTKAGWLERKNIVLSKVYTHLPTIIDEARNKSISTSLAVFKPYKILNFKMEKAVSKRENLEKRKALEQQIGRNKTKKLIDEVPYRFYYTFLDEEGNRSRLQILDWEIFQLYRKLARKYGAKSKATYDAMRAKYFEEFSRDRDVYFFLGTSRYWHIRRSRNPFMIIGVFYPPK